MLSPLESVSGPEHQSQCAPGPQDDETGEDARLGLQLPRDACSSCQRPGNGVRTAAGSRGDRGTHGGRATATADGPDPQRLSEAESEPGPHRSSSQTASRGQTGPGDVTGAPFVRSLCGSHSVDASRSSVFITVKASGRGILFCLFECLHSVKEDISSSVPDPRWLSGPGLV